MTLKEAEAIFYQGQKVVFITSSNKGVVGSVVEVVSEMYTSGRRVCVVVSHERGVSTVWVDRVGTFDE